MPLIRIDELQPDVRLGLWHVTERAEDLPLPLSADLSGYHGNRRVEKLVTYALLAAMTGRHDLVVGHEPSGKPCLDGLFVSISHTKGWAVVMLSPSREVAVDIEYRSDRVCRVADRFMRADEPRATVSTQLLCWSAKETAYKFYSADSLQFHEMRMLPCPAHAQGQLTMMNLRRNEALTVHYVLNADYVLTWAAG